MILRLALLALTVAQLSGVTLLTNTSGTISFTTSTFGVTQWLISPSPSCTRVLIVITSLSLQSLELFIYDQSVFTNNGKVIYSCISCGSVQPPPFYSTTGLIGIKANYVGSVSGLINRFSLMFAGELTYLMDTTFTFPINVGYASLSPVLAGGLLQKTNQTWLISPPCTGPQCKQLIASISAYSFPPVCGTVRLNVFDTFNMSGTSLYSACKQSDFSDRWLISGTGRMMVVLTSSAPTSSNFTFSFFSDNTDYNCGSFLDPNILSDSTFVVTDGSSSTSDMKRGLACHWVIGPTFPTPGTITMTFDYLSIKSGGTLQVADSSGVLLYRCDGNCVTNPPPLTSLNSALTMVFTSDSSISLGYKGFFGRFMTNYAGSRGLGNNVSYLYMSSAYKLQLPGNGTTYAGAMNYTWMVRPSTAGPIILAVEDISILRCGDLFSLYDGSLTNVIYTASCQTSVSSRWVIAKTGEVTAVFQSANPSSLQRGHVLWSYTSDGPNYHCGSALNPLKLTYDSWLISDGSSSSEDVYSNQNCEWDIAVTNNDSIAVVFERFELYGGVLNIYNGSLLGTLLYSIGNTNIVPVPILFETANLYLSYTTGSIVSGLGFLFKYFTSSGPGDGKLMLSSSSSLSVVPYTRLPNLPLQITIDPAAAYSPIYVIISEISFISSTCDSYIEFFDGLNISSPSLAKFCGSNQSNSFVPWITGSSSAITASYVLSSPNDYFHFGYYSDGTVIILFKTRLPLIEIRSKFALWLFRRLRELHLPVRSCYRRESRRRFDVPLPGLHLGRLTNKC